MTIVDKAPFAAGVHPMVTRSSCSSCWHYTIGIRRDDHNASKRFHPIGTRTRSLGSVQNYPNATGRLAVRAASRSLGSPFDWENDVRHRKKDRSRYKKRRQETGFAIQSFRSQRPMIQLQQESIYTASHHSQFVHAIASRFGHLFVRLHRGRT